MFFNINNYIFAGQIRVAHWTRISKKHSNYFKFQTKKTFSGLV